MEVETFLEVAAFVAVLDGHSGLAWVEGTKCLAEHRKDTLGHFHGGGCKAAPCSLVEEVGSGEAAEPVEQVGHADREWKAGRMELGGFVVEVGGHVG